MSSDYHLGELEVQAQAGVRDKAARMIRTIRAAIPPVAQEFLRSQPMAVLGTVDARGRAWASLVTGEPGFMQAVDERTVRIDAEPTPGDPLRENLQTNDVLGLVAVEFATRKRIRINGTAEVRGEGELIVHTEQVYSNCPKYIQAREWELLPGASSTTESVQSGTALTDEQRQWIAEADTFFIASYDPEGGADASHRGGNPGFVRAVHDKALVWPDYVGNNMFNTLGNVAQNPMAGLLFMDFENGDTLQVTGRVRIVWEAERAAKFAGAERLVEFDVEEVIHTVGASPVRWRFVEYSRYNPG